MTLIFSCVCSFVLHAQETYLWLGVHGNDFSSPYEYHMYDYDIHTGDAQLLFTIDSSQLYHDNLNGLGMRIESFEFSPDRQSILLLESEGDLYSYDIMLGELTYLQDITPENTNIFWYGFTETYNLTQLNDSLYFIGGSTIGLFNYNTFSFTKLSQPPDLFEAQTDIQWSLKLNRKVVKHKGRWIALDGDVFPRFINPYDPEDHELALDIDLTPFGHNNSPLLSYTYDCDSTVLYILDKRGHTFARDSVEIDRLNLEDGTIERAYSHLGLFPDDAPSYSVFEVKHYNNPTWESCQRKIDLDEDNSTIEGVGFLIDSLCGFNNVSLSDFDIKISNEEMLDSIVIDIVQPSMDVLINIDNGNYILNNGMDKISIENNGTSNLEDFEIAIRNGYLDNLGEYQEIILSFTAWYGGLPGESAIATLKFATPLPMSGDDIERVFCEGDPVLNIDNMIAPNADLGGLFYNDDYQQITALPNYQAPVSDSIYYITTNGVCYDTARILIRVNSNPEILSVEDFTICPDESVTIDLSNYTEQIEWSDGALDVIRIFEDEGIYMYELRNEYGCTSKDTFIVEVLSASEIKPIEAKVCQDEVFSFMDTNYEVAGLYSDTITNNLGCDSVIYNIDFDFYDNVPLEIMGDFGLCDDEPTVLTVTSSHENITLDEVDISNESFFIEEPGIYQIAGYDEHGCYYEESIEIAAYDSPMIWTEDLLDTIFSTDLALPVTYEGDIISYSWLPSFGLDCNDCAIPKLLNDENSSYTIEVIDENGCVAEENITVSFVSSEVHLPTVIANNPNMPENGTLYLSGNQIGMYSLQVYDRWGNQLFDKDNLTINDPSQGWTPAAKYNSGVYVYVIKYEEKGEEKILVGDITLL